MAKIQNVAGLLVILGPMAMDEIMMGRCIELAENGLGSVAPNPMVGCVIVKDGQIIGEGWHRKFGEAHAEVNAIHSVNDSSLIPGSTVYVSLEPCAHYGKTPPCADLLAQHQVAEVVIACQDSFSEVSGKGIEKLRASGIKVRLGILEEEARELNKRFFTFHEKKRPYIMLKWAQTADGFIDKIRGDYEPKGIQHRISGEESRMLAHKWRAEEAAILVGTQTALNDNPRLTVRDWHGNNPVRLVLDKDLKLPGHLHLFDGSVKTLVFTASSNSGTPAVENVQIGFKELAGEISSHLYQNDIQSLIVEGGKKTLEAFIAAGLWDEARIFVSESFWYEGLKAPTLSGALLVASEKLRKDNLFDIKNSI